MKRLTGKIAAERIRMAQVPRAPEGIIERIRAIGCDSSMISDAMDHFGIAGTLPASLYRPTIAGAAIVGTATTVRNQMSSAVLTPHERAQTNRNGMAEMEAHNQATEGDILVIDGVEFNLSEWLGATNTEGGMNPPDQSSGSTEEWSHSR